MFLIPLPFFFYLDAQRKHAKELGYPFVIKIQVPVGGRGKAGGVKLVTNINDLENEAKKMMGKVLVTHQTGPEGKTVKRLYIDIH